MNPILKYVRDFLASRRVVGRDVQLSGKVGADHLLQQLIDDKKVPGLAISVRKNNQVFFQKGYGFSNVERQTPINPEETIFRIASVSKPIAATALAVMVAEGQLDLDASFYQYVPYYPKKEYDFTIRQLASHTAGIRGYKGVEYGLNLPMGIKESLKIFKDDPLVFKPGTQYLYTSFAWVLISLAIEEISGVPFADYVQIKVLKPFGLKNTVPEIPEEAIANMSSFYSRSRSGFRAAIPVDNRYKLAGGGYLSTAVDIANFGQAFLDSSSEVVPDMSQFLTSTVIEGGATYYGLGWQVSEDKLNRPYFGHVGNGVGGYAVFYVYPEEDMVFSILTNSTNPRIQETLEEVVSMLIGGRS
ncbi:serine hydrolase domain-containing protein [Arenibacter certesii]|uniref:Serine hydrolase n=1 Tax=Arenibacter certesii TaxID=228955 RepID=A0A918MNL1_9FLAO|nr:serine hydrolase domain-containing protein [Arenibacter certesii]GGW39805.1 serine hydrolase [Arenibacter certesii]